MTPLLIVTKGQSQVAVVVNDWQRVLFPFQSSPEQHVQISAARPAGLGKFFRFLGSRLPTRISSNVKTRPESPPCC